MDTRAIIELIPGLLMTGKAEEALENVHVLTTQAQPVIAAGVLSDPAKVVPTLEAMAKDGRYQAINDAAFALGKIAIALVAHNPADLAHVMDVARSLIPAKPGTVGA